MPGWPLGAIFRNFFWINPTAQQVIIAHSHGGNIAFYAARASPIPRLKIVTLGTPFIQANPRSIGPLVEMFDYAGKVVFYVLFVILAYIVVVFLIVMNNDATLPMGARPMNTSVCLWPVYSVLF
jgi:hypothetical protein